MNKKNSRRVATVQTPKVAHATQQASKPIAEQKHLKIGKGASLGIALVVTLCVAALGIFHLVVRNSDTLYMAQSQSFFTTNNIFLQECMHLPGGFISWIASFLTQFFYIPALGASIMIGLWLISMWLSKWAYGVKMAWMAVLSIPVICLLASTIDIGYWIYYMKQTGYWFYGTVGYFFTTLLVFAGHRILKRKDRYLATALVALTYPFLGWYTLLTLAYLAVLAYVESPADRPKGRRILATLFPLVLGGLIPWLFHHLYTELSLEEAWTVGLYHFQSDQTVSATRLIPFYVMAAVPLLFPLLPKRTELKGGMAWLAYEVTILLMVGAGIWTEKRDFQNYNYHAEMRMYQAADDQDWDKVLDEMGNIPGDASRQMVLMKNIALLYTGQMGTKMFKYNNMGAQPQNGFDTLKIHMVQTAAPLIYYYHGKTNFASRWCIENSVEFGYNFSNLKILARCALVGGEMELAKKYLDILSTSLFYRDWAMRLMPITKDPKLIKNYQEFDTVRELRDHMGSVLDGDNGLCEMYLLNYFSNTMRKDSKLLQELTLNYAMVQKDIQLFWPRFLVYAQLHPNEEMPVHYQEAAYLYGQLEPQSMNTSRMPFDEKVVERYQGFQQLSQSLLQTGMKAEEVGEAMKSSYGDTFYWFYFFSRNVHSY